jgi:eukaryotic-like serine/threonine-protein kinase
MSQIPRKSMSLDPVWLQSQFPTIKNLAPLSQGGQKCVFSGDHPTEGPVVLKFFHLATDPDRAVREVQAVQTIQSPRVPRIHEIGTIDGSMGKMVWVREQRLQGQSLRDRLRGGPLDPKSVLRLALHISETLVAAEEKHIVHRDVKPDNIFIDQAGNFWLLDFGLARHLDKESLTATGAAFGVGTLGYSPGEQFRNRKEEIDARADLFALGVTLYESLQGKNPFREGARDFAEILRRVESTPLPAITVAVDADGQFRDFVQTMSRTRRDHRPPNAADALKWIQEICQANGVS